MVVGSNPTFGVFFFHHSTFENNIFPKQATTTARAPTTTTTTTTTMEGLVAKLFQKGAKDDDAKNDDAKAKAKKKKTMVGEFTRGLVAGLAVQAGALLLSKIQEVVETRVRRRPSSLCPTFPARVRPRPTRSSLTSTRFPSPI